MEWKWNIFVTFTNWTVHTVWHANMLDTPPMCVTHKNRTIIAQRGQCLTTQDNILCYLLHCLSPNCREPISNVILTPVKLETSSSLWQIFRFRTFLWWNIFSFDTKNNLQQITEESQIKFQKVFVETKVDDSLSKCPHTASFQIRSSLKRSAPVLSPIITFWVKRDRACGRRYYCYHNSLKGVQ